MSTVKEMTAGPCLPQLLRFTLPLLLGNLLQQVYSLADAAIVGRYLGINALASVGASSSVIFLILGFCNGCCGGFAIPVAQKFGARDYSTMRRYVVTSLHLAGYMSVIIALITSLLCARILQWMSTPQAIFHGAYLYLLITFIGIPYTFYYNLLASIIRALGDSQTPFWFLLFSTLLNIVLDLAFILICHWGVAGAAIATLVAQGLSAILCYAYMRRRYDILRTTPEDNQPSVFLGPNPHLCVSHSNRSPLHGDSHSNGVSHPNYDLFVKGTQLIHNALYIIRNAFYLDRRLALNLLYIGAPMGLQFSITAIGSMMLQSANNALGTACVAAFTAAMRLKMFFICAFETLGIAMATFAGQNYGAGQPRRIWQGVKVAALMMLTYWAFTIVVLWPGARAFTLLFVDAAETEVIQKAVLFMHVALVFFPLLGTLCILRYTIQGAGFTRLAMLSGVSEMVARILVSLLFVPTYGYIAVCLGDPTAWAFAVAFLCPAFAFVYNKIKRRIPPR